MRMLTFTTFDVWYSNGGDQSILPKKCKLAWIIHITLYLQLRVKMNPCAAFLFNKIKVETHFLNGHVLSRVTLI